MRVYKTFIKGFDDLIEGGIPEGHIILLCGVPGTMKSSLAYSILYNNAKINGIPSLYITFELTKSNLLDQLDKLGFKGDVEKLSIMDLSTIRENLAQFKGENWFEIFKTYLRNLKYRYDYKLLVLDSMQMLEFVVRLSNPREEIFKFFDLLRNLNLTTILISEMSAGMPQYSNYDEHILADGIIHLDTIEIGTTMHRRIRCIKMRSVNHPHDHLPFEFKNGIFYVNTAKTLSVF
jgi:KaiC/GvpD/RAD55 family RecA-like ATPase